MQLSAALMKEGQLERAVSEARRALELGPENGLAYNVLFTCLIELQRVDQAINVARDALAVSPSDADLHYRFGLTAGRTGDFETAAHQFAYAWLLRPDSPEPRTKFQLAVALLARTPNALQKLKELGFFASDSPKMLNELAWLLATFPNPSARDGQEAARLAERACTITNRTDVTLLATLAAAHAEAGNFLDAVSTAQEALSLARSSGDTKTAELAENLLRTFQSNQPYREEPRP
jgi:Flp pilus assembly protein TadD